MQYPILEVPVDVQSFDQAIARLQGWIAAAERRFVSTCTVYTVMAAQDDDAILQALRHADMVAADGMPLVWLERAAGYRQAERVYGPDLFLALCAQTEGAVRHYLLGGTPGVAEQLAVKLRARFPNLTIVGHSAPSISQNHPSLDASIAEAINATQPDVIWVGLGSPKQDLWMDTYRPHLNAALLIGVGAAFDFISGAKRQAPRWIQRSGLEWLFRLLSEPNRLWRRYLIYNTRFVFAIFWRSIRRARS